MPVLNITVSPLAPILLPVVFLIAVTCCIGGIVLMGKLVSKLETWTNLKGLVNACIALLGIGALVYSFLSKEEMGRAGGLMVGLLCLITAMSRMGLGIPSRSDEDSKPQ